jgi:non-ribosomal peptide synthetase component E (peptide arylation enzyme)
VLLRDYHTGDKRLLAYIIDAAKTPPETGAIRTWLKDQVPEYMVPSTFVILDGMPLTPIGE